MDAKKKDENELSIARIFHTGEFEEIPPRRLQRQHGASIFPNRLRQSVNGPKVLVGVSFQSHMGENYSVSADLLRVMLVVLDWPEPAKRYIAFVSSDDPKNKTVDYYDGRVELEQLLENLRGLTPMPGPWGGGKFYWTDKEGKDNM